MSMPMPPRGAASSFQLAFQFFCAATEVTHYVPNVGNAAKVHSLMQGDLLFRIWARHTIVRAVVDTYDHTHWKARDPVRSPIDKPVRAGPVVGWVTTSESPVLYVFFFGDPLFFWWFSPFRRQHPICAQVGKLRVCR